MPKESSGMFPQDRLFDVFPSIDERVAAIAAANETADSKNIPDAELDAMQARNKEDGAGFSARQAEQAVTPLDPRDIVSEGTKRVAELRRKSKQPKTGRQRTNAVARLSPAEKRRRDDRRDLKPQPSRWPDDFDSPAA